MRTLPAGALALLQGANRAHHQRVWVADSLGALVDFSDYLLPGTVHEQGVNEQVDALTLHFDRSIGASSLSPLMTAAKPIDLGRAVVWEVAVTSQTAAPVSGDWMELFRGTVRLVDPTHNDMAVVCQDLAGTLRELFTLPGQTLAEGTALETAIQTVIDDAPDVSVTLDVPVSPAASLETDYEQAHEPVLQATQALADAIGWSTRYWWKESAGAFRFSLLEPPRDKTVADWTTGPDRYLEVRELKLDKSDIRNHVTVYYGPQDADGVQASVVVQDSASIAKYGLLPMVLREGSESPIQNSTQATALANAAISDLSEPDATHTVVDFDLPHIQVWDLIEFTANDVHYNTAQSLAVQSIRREYPAPGVARITLACRGKPSAGVGAWKRRERAARFVEAIPPAPNPADLALNNLRETELDNSDVLIEWSNGRRVHETWVYLKTVTLPLTADPWPTNEANRLPDYVLDSTVEEFTITAPDEGQKTYAQFEPRDNGDPPNAGQVERVTVEGIPVSVNPRIEYIGQAPASGNNKTDVVAVVADPSERAGRLYAWVNYGDVDEADPAGAADGYIDIDVTGGVKSVTAADVWTLTGGGTANLFNELDLHAGYGKRIWLQFDAEDGETTGQVDKLLRTWFSLIVGATGDWVPEIVTQGAIALQAVGTLQLEDDGVTRAKIIAKAIDGALMDDNALDLTEFSRVVANDSIVGGKLSVNELSEIVDDMGIIVSGELRNAAGTHYLDLDAGVGQGFLVHPGLTLYGPGSAVTAVFEGTLAAGTVLTGRIVVAGNLDNGAVDLTAVIADGVITAPKLQIAELADISDDIGIIVSGLLRNAGNTQGIRIDDSADSLPGTWTTYLDLGATGANAVLKTPQVQLNSNGSGSLGSGISWTNTGTLTISGYATTAALTSATGALAAVIRATTAPTTRTGGSALVQGDMWIDSDASEKPYVWTGSAWTEAYTSISGAYITTGAIQSTGYSAGSAGWKIDLAGSVEFNTGTFRGALAAATGTFNGSVVIDTASLGNDLVLKSGGVTVGSLSTTTGTVTLAAGVSQLELGDDAILTSTGDVVFNTGGWITLIGLPTSNPGGTGRVWSDSGTLKIT